MSSLRIFRRLAPVTLLATAAACAHFARPEQVYLDRVAAPGALPRELDATMRQYAREGFSGTVLIAHGSRVLLYQGYGDANRARHLAATAQTRYPIGALANQFTAAALLQLEAEGRVRLDEHASDWIGPEAGDATIAELLTRAREGSLTSSIQQAARFGDAPLAPPVEQFKSSGPSYALLDRVLSAAAGSPAHQVIRDRLLGPAGLDRTVVDDGMLDDSLVARGYTDPYGATVVVTGVVAPLGDLYRWHQALHAGSVLPNSTRDLMFTGSGNGYGMGWVVGRTPGGARVIQHASDQPGFQLWYGYFPEKDVLVLLAANTDDGFRAPVSERLTQILVDGQPATPGGTTKAERAGGE